MGKVINFRPVLLLIFLGYLFFIFGNGTVSLTNPDEVFYAQTAREMTQQGSWSTPYLFGRPQFEKPILTYWLLRIAFSIFGVSAFAARLPCALFAILGVIFTYLVALLGLKDKKKAFLSGLILMSGGFYIGLARTVFTDMIFSVFILLSLVSFFWGYARPDKRIFGNYLFFIFCALAVLTKGPLGFLIPMLSVVSFLLVKNEIRFIWDRHFLGGLIIFGLLSLPWYLLMISKYGSAFTYEFFYNDHIRRIVEAEHAANDRWYFYLTSIIGCVFPWSLLVVVSLVRLPKLLIKKADAFYVFLTCWLIAVFFTFQFAHSKLTSYIFPLFPALAIIAADFIYDAITAAKRSRITWLVSQGTLFMLLLIPVGMCIAMVKYPDYLSSRIPIYGFIIAFLALVIAMSALILRNKLFNYMYSLALVMPLFLGVIPFIRNDIELHLSSQKACEYLLKNYRVNNTILASKMFARGVRYYTDKEVAVISIPGNPFFSPHPIVFLDSDAKVSDFLLRQRITYCVLKKSSVEDIERQTAKGFKYTILQVIGSFHILKIESPVNSPATS